MIKLDNITLARGSKVVLKDSSLTLFAGDRAGLVGRNGAGKSSLFAALLGHLDIDQGSLSAPTLERLSWVAQEVEALPIPAEQFVLEGDVVLTRIQNELDTCTDMDQLGHLHDDFEHAGGFTALARARKLLIGLGFAQHELAQSVASFSGGWRMRLNLARALMQPSDCLLLDEPTNHLDLDAIVWLEQWLVAYEGLVLVISHDREFLDAVVKTVVHIDQQTLNRYTGNYTSFEAQYAMRMEQAGSAQARTDQRRAELTRFIERFGAKASKAKQAQSRAKMLDKLKDAPTFFHEDAPQFRFNPPESTPDTPIRLIDADCGYNPDSPILNQADVELRSGARIGLLGRNGAGKSTLIKSLCGTLPILSGERNEGKGLKVGYFAQHQIDTLDATSTPLETIKRAFPTERETSLRGLLANYGFKADQVSQVIDTLSGGERSRLALAIIAHNKPNLLVLDEPTNHLDLEARDALTRALASFEGTMVLVSHDRHMLRATADQLWLVADGDVEPFEGDLEDYRQWLAKSDKQAKVKKAKMAAKAQSSPSPVAAPVIIAPVLDKKSSAEVRQALFAKRKPLETERKNIESTIAKLQASLSPLAAQLADGDFYNTAAPDVLAKTLREHQQLNAKLEPLEAKWLELEMAIEALT